MKGLAAAPPRDGRRLAATSAPPPPPRRCRAVLSASKAWFWDRRNSSWLWASETYTRRVLRHARFRNIKAMFVHG